MAVEISRLKSVQLTPRKFTNACSTTVVFEHGSTLTDFLVTPNPSLGVNNLTLWYQGV